MFGFTIRALRRTAVGVVLRWLEDDIEMWLDVVQDRALGLLRTGDEELGRELLARATELEVEEEEYSAGGLAESYTRAFGMSEDFQEELEEELVRARVEDAVKQAVQKNLRKKDPDIHPWGGSDGEQTSRGNSMSYCCWEPTEVKELVPVVQLEEEEVEEPDPQLELFFKTKKKLNNKISARLETSAVPKFLSFVDIEMSLAIDLLESSKIGKPSHRRTHLEVEVRQLRSNEEHMVYVWDPKGTFCLTLEPTASEGRWLIFLNQ
jgi:hypothetical protein